MKALLAQELRAGAFGLSTGLEYEEGHFATTEEVIALSKVAAAAGGFYISHVRDEANHTFESFDEVLRIGREARIPVEITHIKLGSTRLWHMAATRMPEYFATAKRDHVNLMADVYPYTYWHSTIRVLVPDRDYDNRDKVAQALADNGGAAAIRLVHYTPEPDLAGKTLEDIAAAWKLTPAETYIRIVHATSAEVGTHQPMEAIIDTSMSEDDVRWFIAQPQIMFCSDGELHGAHPRGAGSFPRILGRYVREQKVLPLEMAIHKDDGTARAPTGTKGPRPHRERIRCRSRVIRSRRRDRSVDDRCARRRRRSAFPPSWCPANGSSTTAYLPAHTPAMCSEAPRFVAKASAAPLLWVEMNARPTAWRRTWQIEGAEPGEF